MAQTKFDIKTLDHRTLDLKALDLKVGATRQFYAGVGITDLAVEVVRDYVTDLQQKLAEMQKSLAGVDVQPDDLRDKALAAANARVEVLTKDAKARRAAVEARVAELQADAKALPAKVQDLVTENVTAVNDTYGDLVKRGESLVGRIRKQESTKKTVKAAETTVAKAKTTKTQATKAAKATKTAAKSARTTATKKSTAPRSSAKATATAAKKTAARTVEAVTDAAKKVGD